MNFDFIQTISCTFNCHIRDLFNWAWSCHGHGLDPATIGFEFSCHIPNQSKANLKSGSAFPLFLSHAQSWSVFDTMIWMWSDKCVSKARSRKSLWHNSFLLKIINVYICVKIINCIKIFIKHCLLWCTEPYKRIIIILFDSNCFTVAVAGIWLQKEYWPREDAIKPTHKHTVIHERMTSGWF